MWTSFAKSIDRQNCHWSSINNFRDRLQIALLIYSGIWTFLVLFLKLEEWNVDFLCKVNLSSRISFIFSSMERENRIIFLGKSLKTAIEAALTTLGIGSKLQF